MLIKDDVEGAIGKLKAAHEGEIEIAGPHLAGSLTGAGLIDEYRIYRHPIVLGQGTPYFAGPRPPLRLTALLARVREARQGAGCRHYFETVAAARGA